MKFLIYFENATSPFIVEMMNQKGFTHRNVLVKAFAIPDSFVDLLPNDISAIQLDTDEVEEGTVYSFPANGRVFRTSWREIEQQLSFKGMNKQGIEHFKCLFLYADKISLWQRALELDWGESLNSSVEILKIVDGLRYASGDRKQISHLHIDLFIPDVLERLFPVDKLLEIEGGPTSTKFEGSVLDFSVGGFTNFRQGNSIRGQVDERYNSERFLPNIK